MKEIRELTEMDMKKLACGFDDYAEAWEEDFNEGKPVGLYADPETGLADNKDYFSRAYLDLMRMCGLEEVKQEVDRLISALILFRAFPAPKFSLAPPRLNMMLTGNPGTGKSTVARLVAQIYADYGFRLKPTVLIADMTMLLGHDSRETEEKIRRLVDEAAGGTIVIDDLHWLLAGVGDPAVRYAAALLKSVMSDPEKDIVFISTGSEKDLAMMWEKFPELVAGFPIRVRIEDYSDEQLLQMAEDYLYEQEFIMTADGEMTFRTLIEMVRDRKMFANFRTIRDAIDSYIIPQACFQTEEGWLGRYRYIDMGDFPDLTVLARALCGE